MRAVETDVPVGVEQRQVVDARVVVVCCLSLYREGWVACLAERVPPGPFSLAGDSERLAGVSVSPATATLGERSRAESARLRGVTRTCPGGRIPKPGSEKEAAADADRSATPGRLREA